ncbi:MAG: helix-turn-helix domain-containing protein [Planctomycetota bacterium]|jgi:transcriptional regulator with XRE-family HTH domain
MSRKRKPKSIGQRIKAIRLASEMTQCELGKRADVSQGYLSQVENEKFHLEQVGLLRRIAKGLGVSVGDLVD